MSELRSFTVKMFSQKKYIMRVVLRILPGRWAEQTSVQMIIILSILQFTLVFSKGLSTKTLALSLILCE